MKETPSTKAFKIRKCYLRRGVNPINEVLYLKSLNQAVKLKLPRGPQMQQKLTKGPQKCSKIP